MNPIQQITNYSTAAYLSAVIVFSIIFVLLSLRQRAKYADEKRKPGHIIVFGTLLTGFILAAGGWFAAGHVNRATRNSLLGESRQYGESVSHALKAVLHNNDNIVDALSGATPLNAMLQNPTPDYIESANKILDRFRASFGSAVCYVLDSAGVTVASSNRLSPESFVGKKYAFRPYFTEAKKGNHGSYFALGITSGTRGYYASAPIRTSDGRITGVAVVKHNIDTLESLLQRAAPALIYGAEGIIFMASSPDLLYRPLFPMDSARLAAVSESNQFGTVNNAPVFRGKTISQTAAINGNTYLTVECPVPEHALNTLFLISPARTQQTRLLVLLGVLALIIWVYAAGIILYMEQISALAASRLAAEVQLRTVMTQAQKALQESEERFKNLADTLPEAVYETDLKGKFTYVNQNGIRMFGHTPESLVRGITMFDLVIPENIAVVRENVMRLLAGGESKYQEYTGKRLDGSTFPLSVHSVIMLRDGKPAGMRGIAMDITDRKNAEKQMLQADKLNALGVLGGGLAHDFNNLLTAIWSGLSLLRLSKSGDTEIVETVSMLEEAVKRGRDLTGQLLTYSRGGAPVRKSASLRQIVEDTARFTLSGSSATIDITACEGVYPVDADPGQISQVVQNLLLNAAQAMSSGGNISVLIDNMEPDAADRVGLPRARYVRMQLADQGPGIPAEIAGRIFDPFFTTKTSGTGLGLATAHAIIARHDGRITVGPSESGGALFTVILPASATPPALEPSLQPVVTGKGKILLMDDDPVIRHLGLRLLSALGYSGIATENGEEAIKVFSEEYHAGNRFDAVIFDLTVKGGMSGKEAIPSLRSLDPSIKAIVSSGYFKDPVMAEFRRYGFDAVLSKPYSTDELGRTLDNLLKHS